MSIEPTYHYFENDHTRQIVSESLKPLLPFFPTWAREIRVFSGGAPSDCAEVSIESDIQYRLVRITVYAPFFDRSEGQQARTMLHEMLHSSQAELIIFVEMELLEPIKDANEDLYNSMRRQLQERIERVTQELAFLFIGLVERTEGAA